MSWLNVAHKVLETEDFPAVKVYQTGFTNLTHSLAKLITPAELVAGNAGFPEALDYIAQNMKYNGITFDKHARRLFELLSAHQTNCWGSTLAYLATAEKIGLPLVPIKAPGHVFVRWEQDGKRANWETTRTKDQSFPDERYATIRKIHPKAVENGVYLTPMTEKQMLSQAHANAAAMHLTEQDWNKAEMAANEAVRLDINNPDGWAYMGLAQVSYGQPERALLSLQKTHALDPHHYDAWEGRLVCYHRLGQFDLIEPTKEMIRDCLLLGTLDTAPTPEERKTAMDELESRFAEIKESA